VTTPAVGDVVLVRCIVTGTGVTTTTFTIHRNNRRFNAKKFSRYEEARSYVRKWIRKNTESLPIGASVFDYSNNEYRNPSVSRYGFSIKRVEG
jgi:hypothetical protein